MTVSGCMSSRMRFRLKCDYYSAQSGQLNDSRWSLGTSYENKKRREVWRKPGSADDVTRVCDLREPNTFLISTSAPTLPYATFTIREHRKTYKRTKRPVNYDPSRSRFPLVDSTMLSISVLLALLAATSAWAQSSTVDAYIASESPIAKAGILGIYFCYLFCYQR
jgi:hypothetical protein